MVRSFIFAVVLLVVTGLPSMVLAQVLVGRRPCVETVEIRTLPRIGRTVRVRRCVETPPTALPTVSPVGVTTTRVVAPPPQTAVRPAAFVVTTQQRPAPIVVASATLPPPPPPLVVATPVVTTVATTEPPPIPTDPTTRPVWVGFREDRPANQRAWQIRAIVCFAPTVAEAQNARGRAICRRWAEGSGWVPIPRAWNWNRVVAVIGAGVVPAPTDVNQNWQNYHAEFCVTGRDAPRSIMVTSEDATEGSHSFIHFLPARGCR